jgi:hypothetical protein
MRCANELSGVIIFTTSSGTYLPRIRLWWLIAVVNMLTLIPTQHFPSPPNFKPGSSSVSLPSEIRTHPTRPHQCLPTRPHPRCSLHSYTYLKGFPMLVMLPAFEKLPMALSKEHVDFTIILSTSLK